QSVKASTHIGHAAGQVDTDARRDGDHAVPLSNTATRRANTAGLMLSSTLRVRPFGNPISACREPRGEPRDKRNRTNPEVPRPVGAITSVRVTGSAIRTGANAVAGSAAEIPGS